MSVSDGLRKPGRLYCEAFPMLDVHEVLRAAAGGRSFVQWVDEDDLIVGFASIQELTDDAVRFFFRFYGTRNVERDIGQLDVPIRRSMGGKYWNKPSFICPKCQHAVTRLYWVKGYWACKTSHDLCGIAQRLTPVNKAIYAKEVHEPWLRNQSEANKNRLKIARRRLKYSKAVSLLAGDHRTELPWNLQFRTFGRWLEPGEEPAKVDVNGVGYGWTPGMTGQMPGLEPPSWPPRKQFVAKEKRSPPPSVAPSAAPVDMSPRSRAPGAVDPMEWLMGGIDLLKPLEIDLRLPWEKEQPEE